MKKQLLQNMLAAIAALFIAIIALPTTAQAQDYVDLGLPSGTKWATCNLGASKPSESATTTHGVRPSPRRNTLGRPTNGCRPATLIRIISRSTPSPTARPRASGIPSTAPSSATARPPSKRPMTQPPRNSARLGACRPWTKSRNF